MTQPKQLNNAEKEQRLNAIIAEYLKRKDAGQNVSKDSMLKAYPDLADGLRSYFQNEVMIGENVPALAATKLSPISPATDVRETLKPGAALADTASEFGNRKFGRYQILRPLGEGAMGSVYLALDTTLDRQVALKVPKTEGTANAEFMARFTREAKAAAGLKHANICRVYDAGDHEGTAYITMDFIDGVPLSRFIGTEKLQSVDSILQMILTIADAIGHAHSKGVIHRDLKPGNILVDADFKPHVTDFGLARRAGGPADESRITQEGLLIGTPAYMAPEQVKGEQAKVGAQSDIYSLGVILFELLTHRLPFEGKVPEMLAKVLRDAPPVPSRIRKDLSEEVDDLCLKMLQKSPEHRFASISELTMKLEALRSKLREASVPSNQPSARQKSPFEIQKAHIELMLKKGLYAAAIQDLEKLAQETLPGAKAVADWARTKLPIIRKEAKALSPSGLEALLKTAHQMFQKSDYVGCAQLIEDIPPLRRTEAMEDLLDKAKRREAEADQLLLAIKDKESRQDIDGLESLVRKLLKLKPGNAYAKRLSEALQSYSKTPATRRKYRYEKGRLQPMPEPSFLRQWAVLGSLVGILVFLSVYSYVIFYLKSGNQILAVHVDDEWLKSQGGEVTLVVDGDNHTITTPSTGGDPVTVTVSLGQHTFTVKHGDTIVHDPRQFIIEKDGRKVLSITATDVRLENGVPAPRPVSESVGSNKAKPSAVPEPKTQANDNVGWISLFDGRDLTGWVRTDNQMPAAWKVENGYMEVIPGSGNIMTSSLFPLDFQLHVEFWIPKEANKSGQARGNSGVFLLGRHEIQIVDVFENPEPQPTNMTIGALYKSVEPQGAFAKPPETWQTFDITFHAPRFDSSNGKDEPGLLTVKHDGKVIVDNAAVNEKFGPGGSNTDYGQPGPICLQDHFSAVRFRNIRIRELSPASESKIPSGVDVFEGHSYKFYNESLSWSEAKKKCESMGGHLPVVESAAQNEFLVKLADSNFPRENRNGWESIWLGMTDKETEGDWRWIDGTPFGYTNWFRLQPNNTENEEHFGLLWLSNSPGEITGQWCDQPDHTQKHVMAFICEWDTERTQVSKPSSAADPLLMAIAPFDANQAKQHQEAWATHLGQPVEYANSIGMKLRLIPPGEFMMGSPDDEPGRDEGEKQHRVRISKPFYMAAHEVTRAQFEVFVQETGYRTEAEADGKGGGGWDDQGVLAYKPEYIWRTPGFPQEETHPVVHVSWNDAQEFTKWLSVKERVEYRLPTEAEWEYACRAGSTTMHCNGNDPTKLVSVGNIADAKTLEKFPDWTGAIDLSDNFPYSAPVGSFQANAFDLNDLHGNVWEWCDDRYDAQAYDGRLGTTTDPCVTIGTDRVKRGGAWTAYPYKIRSAYREQNPPNDRFSSLGFRVVRSIRTQDEIPVADGSSLPQISSSPPPLAIAPFDATQAKKHQEVWATHLGQPVEYANSIGMKLRLIPPGEFMMGSPDGETGRAQGEGPLHPVRLTQPFYIGMTEVTQSQWFAMMETRPWQVRQATPEGNNYPATFVSWNDAVAFCEKMSSADGVTYRLPTEAEWEFACRAGTSTEYSFGSDFGQLGEFAWTVENADHTAEQYAHIVGTKKANSFGLSDMHGNVYELCQDHMGSYIDGANIAVDPTNSADGEYRVTRGGAWDCGPFEARSATRGSAMPDFYSRRDGFRVVRVVKVAYSGSAALPDKQLQEPEIRDPNASLKNISQVHGATAEELVAWAKNLPAGYRPYWLSVRGNTNPILYDAVASKTADQSEWIMQFHEYGDWDDWEKMTQEYRPTLLNVYAKNNAYERLVLWVKDDVHNEYWNGSHGFMEEKLKEGLKWDQGAKSNRERWLPTSIAGHWVDGSPEYDMLMTWLPYHQSEWSLDLPLDELPALVEEYREKGWQPAHLNIINGSSPARCSAVFGDNTEKRKWTFSPKLSVNEYRSMLTKVDDLGGQPQCVFSRVENDEVVYSVLWHGVEL